ncbi:MAG: DNA mismatch repair protein MutS [Prevotellaceae bacterium]|nr:DNA mismatch repair protein MutS [Prevotellaceae bacterium]
MAKKDGELTPMMKQFYEFKSQHPDALLLFRCGDFYETYCDDAVDAAQILGITLTRRNNGASQGDAMAGFPHHALDSYIPKLIRAGRRVAICDQLEDPKLTKKLVKRGITELVTPGVAMNDNVLDCKQNNFLCAIHFGKNACGISFLDISTGEFLVDEGMYDYIDKMLSNFHPKEILIENGKRRLFEDSFGRIGGMLDGSLVYDKMEDWVFTEQTARQKLNAHFKVKSMKGFGVENLKNGLVAAGAILQYLERTQHTNIGHIIRIQRIEAERYVRLDNFTIRNLELLDSMHNDGANLVSVIDKTVSPMGARQLRRWIVFPLREKKKIEERLDMVDYMFKYPDFRYEIDENLQAIGDLERISSKIATGRVSPRELVQLKNALSALEPIKHLCQEADIEILRRVGENIDPLTNVRDRIEREIMPEPPQLVNKGGVIREGVNAELDDLRRISTSGKDYLMQIQRAEAERTGISSLKIGYNNVFGYYLEVRNTFKENVPPEWIRKQTLAQAERYITQELKEYEEKILGAEDKILALETRLYSELVESLQASIESMQIDAQIVGNLDCMLSFSKVAVENHYVRPVIEDSKSLVIKGGRHPVIEKNLPIGEGYVPNDVELAGGCSVIGDGDHQHPSPNTQHPQIIIITGPNMAGKSALLRQTALIVLMAQIGCYVPAESAKIGVVDKIFTRVGASDNLSVGESTFMVEMTEAANILNNATDRSLVLFDELGRGTSTYDGISIAWAIVEYLHEHSGVGARTLFATHYHELNEMEKHFPRIKNYNVSVKEMNGKVIFLRKLVEGGSEHSFGIHVAQLAGMPSAIVKRANVILKALEEEGNQVGAAGKPDMEAVSAKANAQTQLSFFQLDDPVLCQVRDEILGLDVNNLTPLEALNKLNEIKKIVAQ